ncbi:hypothetical protein [Lentilactobacillus kosonis]|uniref:Uncharacterized protein n=1 Tax=Lentilactobacillus kosonis TaxID=2810561 RepID=A0A401FKR8_9LACO|nr:hypothetical protein [Lentilactobacillus kosonis]GAY72896.1 hypothetical protein NBRC111893_1042 [Lentilactobacillus kosonis]
MDQQTIFAKVEQAEAHLLSLPFTFMIGKQSFSKDDLVKWQRREYLKTAKLLNKRFSQKLNFTSTTSFITIKEEVVLAKMAIGQNQLKSQLAYQSDIANLITKLGVKTSFNHRKISVADMYLKNSKLTAQQIANTLNQMFMHNTEDNQFYNFKANPNHFYSYGEHNQQTVVEMTGGTRLTNDFTLSYGDNSGLSTTSNKNFRFELSGTGRLTNGFIIGGVRHLITDEPNNTIHARLQVEFPDILPNSLINQHAIHLLVEFSNWLTDIDLMAN